MGELQAEGTLSGEIRFHNRGDSTFIAQRWATSSTAR
jgi:hypothetical protein